MKRRLLTTGLLALVGIAAPAQTSVTTQHNDIARTGANTNETILTPSNVNTNSFGKLFSAPVDGWVYAQPLYMPSVTMGAGTAQPNTTHNVVFVATENDSVFAFDADSNTGANANPLWQVSLISSGNGAGPGETTVPASDLSETDIVPQVGITSTPVIDPTSNTLYVVAKSTVGGTTFIQRLHALDITTGLEKFGGPVELSGSVPGTGNGSSGGTLKWDPMWENNRTSLLLVNGIVYIGFGSHADNGPWHGWILAYNAATLSRTGVWCTSPNAAGAGIWMGGTGLAADVPSGKPYGRLFTATGNGTFDAVAPNYTNAMDYGDSIIKLDLTNGVPTMSSAGTTVGDDFTPFNQAFLSANDWDQASGGVLILPTSVGGGGDQLVQVGKSGVVHVLNRENLGGYNPNNTVDPGTSAQVDGLWGAPAYWNGQVYVWTTDIIGTGQAGSSDNLMAFGFANGAFTSSSPSSTSAEFVTWPSPSPSISANGTTNGIVWSVVADNYASEGPAILYAHEASNVATLLYSSNTNPARDNPGNAVKFVVPTVVNGKVYVGAESQLSVYGLLAGVTPAATPVISPASESFSSSVQVTIMDTTAGASIYYTTDGSTPTTASTQYTAQFSVTTTTTVNAIAAGPGLLASSMASVTYALTTQVATPTFNPLPGYYSAAQSVTISTTTPNSTIYYTLDGTTPTTGSTPYAGPVSVGVSEILSALAVDNTGVLSNSPVASGTYFIDIGCVLTGDTCATRVTSIDLAAGFTPGSMVLVGNAESNGTALELTDGGEGEASAAWYPVQASFQAFTTNFSFQINPASTSTADGFTFTIQGDGVTSIGPGGGGLGFGPNAPGGTPGIGNSVAVKFDLYSNAGEGDDSTGLYTDGASPTVPAVDMTNSGVNLHSGDVFQVQMTYDGATLIMTITDAITNATFTTSWAVNIPNIVGGNAGYLGFTGGTGGLTSTQEILSWTFNSTPTITSLNPTSGAVGTSVVITGTNFGATQGTSAVTFNGIAATPTSWSGTSMTVPVPAGATTGNVVVTVATVASNGVSFTVTPPMAPVITSPTTASGTVGTAFSYQITASNTPTSYGATGLPAGLSVNSSTGLISGTPTAVGTSMVTLSATNSGGTGNATLTLTIAAPAAPVITSAATASGAVGIAFSYQITATNTPTSFGATGLPAGLSVNSSTGLISGTPTAAGTSTVTLSASNSGGTGNATLTLTIAAVAPYSPTTKTCFSQGVGTQASTTCTPSLSFSTGELMVCWVTGSGTGQTFSVTDSNSDTFSQAGTQVVVDGAYWQNFYFRATTTITGVTFKVAPSASYPTMFCDSATGGIGTPDSVTSGSASGYASGSSSPLTIAFTVSGSADYVLCLVGGSSGTTVTHATAFTAGTGSDAWTYNQYEVASSSSITATVTWSGTDTVRQACAAFQSTPPVAPVITSATTASGTVGTGFSYQITASNTPTSFAAAGLPAGLSVSSSTGLISGTPTATGTSTVTLSATNSGGTGTATLMLTIAAAAAPVITSATTASGNVGTAFSYQITATNSPSSYGATGLPAGLSLSSSTGLISGTPTATGTSTVTLSATNIGGTGTAGLTLTISAPAAPVITSATTASGTVGTTFSYQITATNTPTSYGATGLPAGLSVNSSTGLISGPPTATGTSTVTLSASNSGGTGTANLTLTVSAVAAPVITSATTASGNVGTAFSYQITATNTPTSFGATGLPAGLSVNSSTGLISGTPTATGTSTVTLSASDSGGTGTATLRLTISAVAAYSPTTKTCYSQGAGTKASTTCTPSSSFSAGELMVCWVTGSGAGQTFSVTDSNSDTFSSAGAQVVVDGGYWQAFYFRATTTITSVTFKVSPSASYPTQFCNSTTGGVGTPDSVTGGSASGYVSSGSSPLPITFTVDDSADYVLCLMGGSSGTTVAHAIGFTVGAASNAWTYSQYTVASSSSITATVTWSGTNTAREACVAFQSVTVAPVITSATTASGTVGTAFSYQIAASNTPTSYGATGLPAGLSVNSSTGLISGTPTATGTSTVTLSASNSAGTGSAILTLTISAPAAPVITSATTTSGNVGTAFSYQITATNSPTSFGATGLPAGLSVSSSTGLISGTPTATGTSMVTLSATNSGGTGSATLTLTISAVAAYSPTAKTCFSQGAGTQTSTTCTPSASFSSGELMVCWVTGSGAGQTFSLTDSNSDTFSPAGGQVVVDGSYWQAFYFRATTTITTVTFKVSPSASYPTQFCDSATGGAGAPDSVTSGSASGYVASGSSPLTMTFTVDGSADYILCLTAGTSGTAVNHANGFTVGTGSDAWTYNQYTVASSASITSTVTWAGTDTAREACAAFQ